MSQKIPFLQMFSALRQWTELTNGVERWVIVSAAVDRSSRSAKIVVEGAAGAGPNLIAQAEEALCLVYQLKSVWIEAAEPTAQEEPKKVNEDKNSVDDSVDNFAAEPGKPLEDKACGDTVPKRENENSKPESVDDAFARTEALRAKRLQSVKRAAPSVKAEKKPQGKAIFGKLITKAAVPIGELELDMGTVVVEGDVFAVDNRELKKRGAWVVAFDMTDYTGSIRINRFFAGDEGKPLVDEIGRASCRERV